MAEFEHNGTKITFNESNGDFVAYVNSVRVEKLSLAAMKKHIDGAAADGFKAFSCLLKARYSEAFEKVNVIGFRVEKKRDSWRKDKLKFVIEGEQHIDPSELFIDTPENMVAYKAADKYRKETQKIEEDRSEKQKKLWDAVKHPGLPIGGD